MDGVLADSEPTYLAAVNSVLEPLGKAVSEDLHNRMMGHGVEASWRILMDDLDLPGAIDDYIPAYDRELVRSLAAIREPLMGARELVSTLKGLHVPIAVASSSLPAWMEALLSGTGLRHEFDVLCSATEVAYPKPAPDLYLFAAGRLRVPPRRCIAIEDTPTGLRSAKAAGMYAVQVRSSSTAFPPHAEADAVIDTLLQFDLSLLRR